MDPTQSQAKMAHLSDLCYMYTTLLAPCSIAQTPADWWLRGTFIAKAVGTTPVEGSWSHMAHPGAVNLQTKPCKRRRSDPRRSCLCGRIHGVDRAANAERGSVVYRFKWTAADWRHLALVPGTSARASIPLPPAAI